MAWLSDWFTWFPTQICKSKSSPWQAKEGAVMGEIIDENVLSECTVFISWWFSLI